LVKLFHWKSLDPQTNDARDDEALLPVTLWQFPHAPSDRLDGEPVW